MKQSLRCAECLLWGEAVGKTTIEDNEHSENDYGETASKEIAKKRVDYFEAGTLVIWDVDVLRGQLIKVYRASEPLHPTVYRRGEIAEAEPALPGWSLAVERLFPPIWQ